MEWWKKKVKRVLCLAKLFIKLSAMASDSPFIMCRCVQKFLCYDFVHWRNTCGSSWRCFLCLHFALMPAKIRKIFFIDVVEIVDTIYILTFHNHTRTAYTCGFGSPRVLCICIHGNTLYTGTHHTQITSYYATVGKIQHNLDTFEQ